MKKYSPEKWANLTPEKKQAIINEAGTNQTWCAEHHRFEPPPYSWSDDHGFSLGWWCRCMLSSSDFPDAPDDASWKFHKESAYAYTNVMWSLFLAMAAFAFIVLVFYK